MHLSLPRTLSAWLVALCALAANSSLPAQALSISTTGPVPRVVPPRGMGCVVYTSPYFLAIAGQACPAPASGHHLVVLVRPWRFNGTPMPCGWVSQCIRPTTTPISGGVRVAGFAQVGNAQMAGGAWYAGQDADLRLVLTTNFPAPGTCVQSPSQLPGFIAASPLSSIKLTAPTSYAYKPSCRPGLADLAPVGVPRLGNSQFRVDLSTSLSSPLAVVLAGAPRVDRPAFVLPGGCPIWLSGTFTVQAGIVGGGQLNTPLPIPVVPSLAGALLGLQCAVVDNGNLYSSDTVLVSVY